MKITQDQIREAEDKLGERAAKIIADDLKLSGWENGKMIKSIFKAENTPSMHWHAESKRFKCFATGKSYGILDHYMSFYNLTFQESVRRLFKETQTVYTEDVPTQTQRQSKAKLMDGHVPPNDEPFNDRAIVNAYMAKRAISVPTLDYCNVKQDPSGNVAFQFIDVDGTHLSTKYRVSRGAKNGEKKWWWQSKTSLLYGIDKIDTFKPLLIVEGLCFPPDAEILTPSGWVRFDNYNDEDVMQVNQDLSCNFVKPLAKIIKPFTGDLVEAKRGGNYYSLTTPDHKLVYMQSARGGSHPKIKKISLDSEEVVKTYNSPKEAQDDLCLSEYQLNRVINQRIVLNGFIYERELVKNDLLMKCEAKNMKNTMGHIPTCSLYNGGTGISLSDAEIQLQVAFSADGSFNKNIHYQKSGKHRIRFIFAKERKFIRLKKILDEIGIQYTETIRDYERYTTGKMYYIGFFDDKKFLTKDFDQSWIGKMSSHQRDVLLSEIEYWDGSQFKSRDQSEYYSVVKNNIDFIQTMCHISGFMSTIKHRKSNQNNCTVSMLHGKNHISWQNMYIENCITSVPYSGLVYCVTVPSGMIMVRQNEKITVTGNCDRLSCVEAGFTNCVSIDGGAADMGWIDFNWDTLQEIDEFILFADDDAPGKKMVVDATKRLGEAKCKVVKPDPDVKKQIGKYYADNYNLNIDKVDANNVLLACGANQLLRLINDAEPIPNEELMYLMDIEDEDVADMEKISTGYAALDEIIYGSFMGCFTILSGQTGSGKSTIANQLCIMSPLEKGYKAFVYSGELPDKQIKNWLVKAWAGPQHHVPAWNRDGIVTRYVVTKEANRAISKFYRNSLVFYHQKDGVAATASKIIAAMEYAHKRNGVKFFEIDNLMVVENDDPSENLWEAQKKFAKMLLKFTNTYNVNVTLIAHPHKISKGEEIGASVISGTSDLGNLCHRLLWVEALKDDREGYNSQITVLKDRTTGRAWKKCKLYYDARTMRVFSSESEKNFCYNWHYNANIVYSEEVKCKLAINAKDEGSEVFGAIPE